MSHFTCDSLAAMNCPTAQTTCDRHSRTASIEEDYRSEFPSVCNGTKACRRHALEQRNWRNETPLSIDTRYDRNEESSFSSYLYYCWFGNKTATILSHNNYLLHMSLPAMQSASARPKLESERRRFRWKYRMCLVGRRFFRWVWKCARQGAKPGTGKCRR